jgi:tartrate dehydratase alpha subunit/fumarate hydratase class I-like protein
VSSFKIAAHSVELPRPQRPPKQIVDFAPGQAVRVSFTEATQEFVGYGVAEAIAENVLRTVVAVSPQRKGRT